MDRSTRIVVFGSSRCPKDHSCYELARAVGAAIGSRGLTLVSGGYGGTMGAASEGARSAGGEVVGITTKIFTDRNPNPHVNQVIEMQDYPTRLARLLGEGDAFVALPGGLGTLSEWVTAWCLATIDQLGGPLWLFEHPWRRVQQVIAELDEVEGPAGSLIRWIERPEQLADELDRWLKDVS